MKITTKQVGARMREARKKKKYTLRYLKLVYLVEVQLVTGN